MFHGVGRDRAYGVPANLLDASKSQTHLQQALQTSPVTSMTPKTKAACIKTVRAATFSGAAAGGAATRSVPMADSELVTGETLVHINDPLFGFARCKTDIPYVFSTLHGMSQADWTQSEYRGQAHSGHRNTDIADPSITMAAAGSFTYVYNGTGTVKPGDLVLATFPPVTNPTGTDPLNVDARFRGNSMNRDPDPRVVPILTTISPNTISSSEFGGDRQMIPPHMVRHHIPGAIVALATWLARNSASVGSPVVRNDVLSMLQVLGQYWYTPGGPNELTGVTLDLPSPDEILRQINIVLAGGRGSNWMFALVVFSDLLAAFSRAIIARHVLGRDLEGNRGGGLGHLSINSRG